MIFTFIKMEAQGNSYVFIDLRGKDMPEVELSSLAVKVSNCHFGVGSDGMVLVLSDSESDAAMRMFNADGSESLICGSAIKQMTVLLAKDNDFLKNKFRIKTGAGIVESELLKKNNSFIVRADLSNLRNSKDKGADRFLTEKPIRVHGYKGVPVNVGNQHFVIFAQDQDKPGLKIDTGLVNREGPYIEQDSFFPDGTNVEFVTIIDRNTVTARVWEWGTGETLSCGSGALAIVLAGLKLDYLDGKVEVKYPGGSKFIDVNTAEDKYYLAGEVKIVVCGKYHYEDA